MSITQQVQIALKAFGTSKEQFKNLIALLREVGPAFEITINEAGPVSASVSLLGWPRSVECRLVPAAHGDYETLIAFLKPQPNTGPLERYRLRSDFLGNFGLGENKDSRIHHISSKEDIQWLCRELVLAEAKGN